ncbi:hypothetical protein CANCADRAFT_122848 [Tortispora caseinolytica NRRL Y-17796]|uniref:Vacuolar-sorting protein SNF7 n=1 Tax=Tortispora caseinolytica NRRL Y-17796 TaxID=767744 RepID=A0A1E4THV8_9ASCO|nr:hypothetical protein CANCADRAFT_122848 [Tortispora caseinolytica NRRL Y-17796]
MSTWLSSMFGAKQTKKDAPKNAIVKLRTQLELLGRKEKYLEQQIMEQDQLARANISTNKVAAKNALRKKKTYETHLERVTAQIMQVQAQSDAIENANLNYETMKVMQEGAKAMKQIHGNMDIDKVDAAVDEIRDQIALSEEIGEAIARPLGSDMIDDDELADELEAMEQEALDAKMVNAGTVPPTNVGPSKVSMPSVPDQLEDEDEEEELRRLQQEMAM